MHFVLQTPSLLHLAQVKIVAHLWNHHDVFKLAESFEPMSIEDLNDKAPEWEELENLVRKKVWNLSLDSLPERCVFPLLDIISPLGAEILAWCHYYNDGTIIKFLYYLLPPQLCWTMHGTVDYAKTAELMVKDERMDLQNRFELACINCLEDQARELFEKVAEEQEREYVLIVKYVRRADLYHLILFYSRSINLDVRHELMRLVDESFNTKSLFQAALPSGNRAMCEYLFERLNIGDKVQVFDKRKSLIIESCTRIQSPNGNLLYYLSLMNEEQQSFMFRECTFALLQCLLRWPAQVLFAEAAKLGWRFMGDICCSEIFLHLLEKINWNYIDYHYSPLFWECWALCSAEYKQFFWGKFRNLVGLVYTYRDEFMELILDETPSWQILALCDEYKVVRSVLEDERSVSCVALMRCLEKAELNSWKDKRNAEKRLRERHIRRLVDLVMVSRCDYEESEYSYLEYSSIKIFRA